MSEVDKIRKILDKHEKRILDLEELIKSKPTLGSIEGEDAILNLINSGFLDAGKNYGETIKELKKQAKFEKGTNYKKIFEKLTSENKLKRKSAHKQWVYSKK